ncbi:phage tail tape measure protein [Saccharibacillus sacchari]|uniref:Phage tail tape measure protein n=1 Tax=Saccharibacillus sacchari TaxID=456493 RepID=A0ACC6PI49_9BACL
MAGGIIGNLMFAVGFKVKDRGLRDADSKIGALTKSVVGLGAAGVAAFAGLGVAAVSAASKFETSMSKVAGTTGQTAAQMEETREIAKNLYSNNFGADWDDLGSSISTVAQITGQTGSELENTTRNALLLRDTFGFEVADSIKGADTMMKQFGITSEQAYGLLAQGAENGLDKSGDLIDTANEYANQFKSLGFTAEEMFDTLGAGGENGAFMIDKVGDAIKEFNIRSKDASKTSIEAFQMLGLNADAMMQTFANGGPEAKQAFSDIVSMIADIEDPVQRNNIGVALMGSQFEDLEVKTIAAMGGARRQFDMTADKMAELNKIKFNSPGQAFEMFKRSLETGILIPIGERILPIMTKFGQWLADHRPQIEAFGNAVGDKLGGAFERAGQFISYSVPYLKQFGSQAAAAFGTAVTWAKNLWTEIQPTAEMIAVNLVGAVVALWPHIQSIAKSMYDVGKAVVTWKPFLPIVTGLTAGIVAYKAVVVTTCIATQVWTSITKIQTAATWAMTAATRAWSLAMAMNPIGLVIAAIVALVAAFVVAYQRSETFRNIVNGVWASIKVAWAATANFFTTTIPAVFNSIVSWVTNAWNTITASTSATWAAITGAIGAAWNTIVGAITTAVNGVVSFLSGAWEGVKSTVSGVGTFIGSTLSGAWEGVKTTFSSAINWIINKFNGMIGRLNSISISNPFTGEQIAGVNIPLIPTIDGSHKTGLDYVPYDGYVAELHKGEEVLTADEARQRRAQPAAARYASGGAAAPVFNINVEVSGGSGSPQEIAAEVARQLQAVIESAGRRLNVQGGTA